MNGSTENRASGAPDKPVLRETVLNLATAGRMLPLVRQIVRDILVLQHRLTELLPEQDRLDHKRRTLAWPERCRRYQIKEEVAAAERTLQEAWAELAGLGIVLLDPAQGRVGFPTLVNSRRAFFSWQNGENAIECWHFADENIRRPIPATWSKATNLRFSAKS